MDYFLSLPALREVNSDVINSLLCAAIKADSALALHGLHRLAGARQVPANVEQLEALLSAMDQAQTLDFQFFYSKDLLYYQHSKVTSILREVGRDGIGKIQQVFERLVVRATESACSECVLYYLCMVITECKGVIQIPERTVQALQDVVKASMKACWSTPPPALLAQQRRNNIYIVCALLSARHEVRNVFKEVDYIDKCCFKVSHLGVYYYHSSARSTALLPQHMACADPY